MSYLYLIISFLLNASANILLKSGASAGINTDTYTLIGLIKNNLYTVFGILFFATSSITYFLTLKHFPISIAYPVIIAMSLLITNSVAFFFLGERITPYQILGYCLVVTGIVLIINKQ